MKMHISFVFYSHKALTFNSYVLTQLILGHFFLNYECTTNFNFMETLKSFFLVGLIILVRIMCIFVLTGDVDNFDPAVTPTLIFCFTSVCPTVISIDVGKA